MANHPQLLKEFEVKLSIKCYRPMYSKSAISDLKEILQVFDDVHREECTIKLKSTKEIKLKQ